LADRKPGILGAGAGDVTHPRVSRHALAALAIVIVLVFAWIARSQVDLEGNSVYSLAWGSEVWEGQLPDFSGPYLPVKHPLSIGVGVVLGPLTPQDSIDIFGMLGILGFLALLYASFRLGRAVGGVPAGALAAILVAAHPEVEFIAARSLVGGPWAALVLLAAAIAIESGTRRWRTILSLLTVAGLLRPEAWPLAAAYGIWVGSRSVSWKRRTAVGALALAAPALWVAADVALTGDPLHTTQFGVESLRRIIPPRGDQPSLTEAPPSCAVPGCEFANSIWILIGWPLGLAGALIAAWALWSGRRILLSGLRGERLEGQSASLSPLVVLSLVLLGVVITLASFRVVGLTVAPRVLLVPAVVLAVFAAAAPWVIRRSPISVALGAILAALVVAGVISGLARYPDLIGPQAQRWDRLQDLVALVEAPAVREAVTRCPKLEVSARAPGSAVQARAGAALVLGLDPADVGVTPESHIPPGGSLIAHDPVTRPTDARVEGEWVFMSRCSL
jgi:hypothetical protein